MSLTSTIDVFEAVILAFFAGAVGVGVFNVLDAWRNELAAIDAADPDVGLLGLEDLFRGGLSLLLMAIPGVVVAMSLMTTTSPLQQTDASPQELVSAIVLRVVLILIACGLFAQTALSAWLRRRMAQRRAGPVAEPSLDELRRQAGALGDAPLPGLTGVVGP